MTTLPRSVALCACCLVLLAACGTTRPSHFYLLTPLEKTDSPAQNSGPGIIVGPVTLPDYLLRPQIALRNDANEVTYEEFHRWAEPLLGNFSRVLAENLSRLLDTSRVSLYPGYKTGSFPYQILIDVIRMDAGSGRQINLVARWSILDRHNNKLLTSNKTSVTRPVDGNGYKAIVSAQSRAVSQLSQEIAQAISAAALHVNTPPPFPQKNVQ